MTKMIDKTKNKQNTDKEAIIKEKIEKIRYRMKVDLEVTRLLLLKAETDSADAKNNSNLLDVEKLNQLVSKLTKELELLETKSNRSDDELRNKVSFSTNSASLQRNYSESIKKEKKLERQLDNKEDEVDSPTKSMKNFLLVIATIVIIGLLIKCFL